MTVAGTTRLNPYVGPRAFRTGETLYGRDQEALALLDLLIAERIVLLYSPSGAGKTSLIQAALIPELERAGFHVRRPMRVNQEPPPNVGSDGDGLNRYVLSALQSLEEALPADRRTPLAELARLELTIYLDRRPPADDDAVNEVLIFDQFEEILTVDPTNRAAREGFFAQVGAALRDRGRWALFSMREDYVAGLDPYLRPVPTRLGTTSRLDLLGEEAARQAIKEPAHRAGVDFGDAAAQKLLDDLRRVQVQRPDGTMEQQLGPYVEPVQLQVVCLRVWEKLPAAATEIAEADVQGAGDVDTALADYYAERVAAVADETGASERAIRLWFDDHLITQQGIRGQVLQERERSQGLENRAIWSLVSTHLVRAEKRRGATWFELSHDRLIEPIRKNNAAWVQAHLSTLQRQAELWEDQGRSSGLLLREQALVEAERWAEAHDDELTPGEREFLAACREARAGAERERQRNRLISRLSIAAAVFSVLAFAALLVAFHFFSEAERQAQIAASRLSRVLAARALNHLDPSQVEQLDLALLLGLEAYRLDDNPETRGALLTVLEHNPQLATFLRGHGNDVTSAAFSPDGTRLASAGTDRRIILWDVATRRPLGPPLEGHAGGVSGVAFSPDGTMLASGSTDRTIILWDVATGQPIGPPFVGHRDVINGVAFSPDGTRLASGDASRRIILWDVATRQPLVPPLERHADQVSSVAFSPDGTTLASGGGEQDRNVILWDVATGQPIGEPLKGPGGGTSHTGWVRSVAFSPDGRTLASGSGDRTIILWDVATRQPLGPPVQGHSGTVLSVAFSPDGTRLASGSTDDTVMLWDTATRQPVGPPFKGHTGWVWSVAFSPDRRTLASGSFDHSVILWDLSARQRLGQPLTAHNDGVWSVAFSPDGTTLATAGDDRTILLWDPATRRPLAPPLEGHTEGVRTLAFSPDGAKLASGSFDDTIGVWDVAGRHRLATLTGHPADVNSVTFSPDSKTLASAGCGRLNESDHCVQVAIHLWDVESGRPLDRLAIDRAIGLWSVAFSPDGKLLASGGPDRAVVLWDPVSHQRRGQPLLVRNGFIRSLAFSPDSRTLAAGGDDNTVILWDLTVDPPAAQPLEGHKRGIRSLAFSPDGRSLASGSLDNTIILWDVAARQRLGRPLAGHKRVVWSVAFSPDGNTLASGSGDTSGDQNVILWDVSVASWRDHACKVAARNLTPDEWRQHLGDEPYRQTCPNLPDSVQPSGGGR